MLFYYITFVLGFIGYIFSRFTRRIGRKNIDLIRVLSSLCLPGSFLMIVGGDNEMARVANKYLLIMATFASLGLLLVYVLARFERRKEKREKEG